MNSGFCILNSNTPYVLTIVIHLSQHIDDIARVECQLIRLKWLISMSCDHLRTIPFFVQRLTRIIWRRRRHRLKPSFAFSLRGAREYLWREWKSVSKYYRITSRVSSLLSPSQQVFQYSSPAVTWRWCIYQPDSSPSRAVEVSRHQMKASIALVGSSQTRWRSHRCN